MGMARMFYHRLVPRTAFPIVLYARNHGMPEIGPCKQVKGWDTWDAGSTSNHTPSGLWKNLSPLNRSLVSRSFGATALHHSLVMLD